MIHRTPGRYLRRHKLIELLESRRHLSSVVNCTSGDDEIVIQADPLFGTNVYVNNHEQIIDDDSSIIINCGDGNDTIDVQTENLNQSFTINGGPGDDHLTVANGNFGDDISGDVYFNENSGEGADFLEIDDVDGHVGGTHDTLHISATNTYADEQFTADATVHYDDNVESKEIDEGASDDVNYVDSIPTGLTLYTGYGNNTVIYGGSSDVLFGTIFPAKVTAGILTDDTLIFNDQNGSGTGQIYNATDDSICNQSIFGFDHIIINSRNASTSSIANTFHFTGLPNVHDITINGAGIYNTMFLGTPSNPFDLSSHSVAFNANLPCGVQINDVDTNDTGHLFHLYTSSNPTRQNVACNLFNGAFQTADDMNFDCGNGDDSFDVESLLPNALFQINGHAGNDSVYTVGANAHDLDAIFPAPASGGFAFYGGPGNDVFNLDDSGDQTGDGDADYFVGTDWLAKGSIAGYNGNALVQYDDSTEQINVTGDADNNIFTFDPASSQHLTINGSTGNDTFMNYSAVGLEGSAGVTNIIAGGGADHAYLTDTNSSFQHLREYDFDAGKVTYDTIPGSTWGEVDYDSSLENLELDENDVGTPTNIRGVLPNLILTVNANNGNDSFIVGGGDLDSNGMNNVTVDGGGGTDSIEFDDTLDTYSPSETETINLNGTEMNKGPVEVRFTSFESTQLDSSSTINGPLDFNPPEVINLNTTAGIPTTIVGGFLRNTTINVGNPITGTIAPINAPVTLTMGGAGGANINNQSTTTQTSYNLSNGLLTVSTGQTIHFSGAGLTLNTGSGIDIISVKSSGTAMPFTINPGGGDDTVTAGSGNLDVDFQSNLTVNASPGSDFLELDNGTDASSESQTLNAGSFTDGRTFSFSVENLEINEGPGGETLNVTSVANYTFINGGAGPDTVNIGTGNLDTALGADMLIYGNGGNDIVTLDDHSTTAGDAYNFDNSGFYKNTTGHKVGTANGITRLVLQCNTGSNTVNVNQFGTPLTIFGNAGNDGVNLTGGSFFNNKPDVTFDGGAGLDGINFITTASSTAKCTLAANVQDLSFADVNAGATLVVPTNCVADIQSSFSLSGIVDMAGGALIYRNGASQLSLFQTRLKNGFNNGAWNGTTSPAINSSLANSSALNDGVGFATAQSIFGAAGGSFAGVSVNANDMLVRYTLNGDANLERKVNALDFNALASHFGATNQNWAQGNFNYDSLVNTLDFNILAANFNQVLPTPAPPVDSSPLAASTSVNPRPFSNDSVFDASADDDVLKSAWSIIAAPTGGAVSSRQLRNVVHELS